MSAFVRFWGTRGSIPTPGPATRKYGGNTSCVEVRSDDTLLICDGGTGLRDLGMDLVRRGVRPIVGHMFFSHTHWDHIQGFPFFTPAYAAENTFYVYGARTGDRRHYELLSGQMRGDYFPVNFADLKSRIVPADLGDAGTRVIEGVKVTAFDQQHPGGSYGFCFERDGWKVVYATDNELDRVLHDEGLPSRDPAARRSLNHRMKDFVQGADLLIADAQYTDEEYPAKVGWGHPRASTVVDFALETGVKQVALFHHDPMHADADIERIVESCRVRAAKLGGKLELFAAREGVELKIG